MGGETGVSTAPLGLPRLLMNRKSPGRFGMRRKDRDVQTVSLFFAALPRLLPPDGSSVVLAFVTLFIHAGGRPRPRFDPAAIRSNTVMTK